MIRQIWKVRNTSGDPVQKASPASQEASEAAAATHNDESRREREEDAAAAMASKKDAGAGDKAEKADAAAASQDEDDASAKEAQKKQVREPILGKAAGAALSVCAYDPNSATVYALVEQAKKGAEPSPADSQEKASDKAGAATEASPTTKTPPGLL